MYTIRVRNNVKLAVYDTNPHGKKAIVLIHGWPLSAKIFEYQIPMLVNHDYRVVAIDLRGFGASDAPACGYSYDTLADDIYQVIRTLNLRSFVLAGFSMGGAIALRYMARRHGYGVRKLALFAAAAPRLTKCPGFSYGIPRENVDGWIEQAGTDRPQLAEKFSRMLLARPHGDAIQTWFREISLTASGIATVQTAHSLRDEDGRADLACVKVPTGIFHGDKDEVVPFELALLQEEGIEGARLFPFPCSGHGIFYDDLETFNSCFLQFLESDLDVQ